MRIQTPLALLALLLVPLALLAYRAVERRHARYAVHYTNIEVLAGVVAGGSRWRRLLPPALVALSLICAVAALARPEIRTTVADEEASIALTVDLSGSMSATDIKPTRVGAAHEAIRRFLKQVPAKYRIGLVTFSSEPFVASPLTRDHDLVLQSLRFGESFGRGTAIGDALARSVELLEPFAAVSGTVGSAPGLPPSTLLPPPSAPPPPPRERDAPPSAILLLSDGAQTRGTLSPLEGAARAKSYGIPVYTVALGTPGGTLDFGGIPRPVPPDPATLRQIAQLTGGEFFATRNTARLNAVYEDLASRLGKTRAWRELSFALAGAAALFALGRGRPLGALVAAAAVRAATLIAVAALGLAAAGCGGGSATVTTVRTVVRTVPAAAAPAASTGGESTADVVARVLPGVVNVRTVASDGDKGEGSGVVIDRRGMILTNAHVVHGARSVTVSFDDGRHKRPVRATVIGTAAERDLAIIRVGLTDLTPLVLGRSSRLRLGDGVLAIGFPLNLAGGPTVTQGIVSGLDRTVHADGGPSLEGLVQTDAAINPGNSGGPLVDAAGRVVGINTVAAASAENVGFAISIDEARPVIDEIRHRPPGTGAWIGVTFDSIATAAEAVQIGLPPGVRGAAVIAVFAGSPAARAALREGDVVVAIGGRAVRSAAAMTRAVAAGKPGDRIVLDVVDGAGPRRVVVTLARRPAAG